MTQVLFNGEWLANDQATISIFSEAVQYGYGLFETLRTYDDKSLPLADRHINRLLLSAAELGLKCNYSASEIHNMLEAVVNNEAVKLQRLKMMLVPEGLAIYTTPLKPSPNQTTGVSLKTKQHQRALPQHKSTAYLDCYLAWHQAQSAGYHDMLFISSEQQVLEASRANIFCITGTEIITPSSGVLGGIMREVLLELDTHIQLTELALSDLMTADGVFITNSIVGMQAVAMIDDNKLGKLTNNAVYNELNKRLENYIRSQ